MKKLFGLLGIVLSLFLSFTLVCSFVGEGMSFTAWNCWFKTKTILSAIKQQDYDCAVKKIAFLNETREIAEEQWVNQMEQLFMNEIKLKEISLEHFGEDDGLVRGDVVMKVGDSVSNKEYFVEIMIDQHRSSSNQQSNDQQYAGDDNNCLFCHAFFHEISDLYSTSHSGSVVIASLFCISSCRQHVN